MTTPFDITDDDLNGECFVVGSEGEREEQLDVYTVICPEGPTYAIDSNAGEKVEFTADQATRFIMLNINILCAQKIGIADAAKIAYLRFLAVRQGLVSPKFTLEANHVKYNNARMATAADQHSATFQIGDAAAADHSATIRTAIPADVKKSLRDAFADAACCVAYVFRVRGHHYRDDLNDKYVTLWSRCLRSPDDLPLAWNYVAIHALHAIMPVHLDGFWNYCASNSHCSGTLSKRYDSAPAGVAGVYALKRGLDDVRMLFPGIATAVPQATQAFDTLYDKVTKSRWGGSVNCRYYGENRIRVNEGEIGALASVVLGVYDQLATTSKLRDSPALKRLAEIAPATGGAIGLAARRAAADERLNLIGYTAGRVEEVSE